MNYLSVFSGIEAASCAWHHLGWKPAGFSEIDPFASAVLAHHYPQTKNYGSITEHKSWGIKPGTIDILIGGSPCQAFSCAGLRQGLADPRGNLTLTFVSLVDSIKPRWVIWENVPGVLSSNGGRDFAAFIWALGQCRYGFSWRVMDAKGTGRPEPIPQRRRRVFLVAHSSGDFTRPAEILFKPESLPRNPDKGATQGKEIATPSGNGAEKTSRTVLTHFRKSKRAQSSKDDETWVQDGHSNTLNLFDLGDTRTTSAVVHSESVLYENHAQDSRVKECRTVSPTVCAKYGTGGGNVPLVRQPDIAEIHCVRRLHPIEAERLQGFPDNWTRIPWKGKPAEACPDSHRFKCIGNSMAVPVIRLLGERIDAMEQRQTQ